MRTYRAWGIAGRVTIAAAVLVLGACSSSAGGARFSGPGTTPGSTGVPASSAPTSTAPGSASTTATPDPAAVRSAASRAIARLTTGKSRVSVAALNTATGASYSTGAKSGLWTASVYKLLVLETLLLQHQRAGTSLSGAEATAATTMIENSDDRAAYQLFLDLGGTPGLTTGIKRLGLTHSVAGRSDPTFTTTSGPDCLELLRNLVSTHSPLSRRSRTYVLGLMRAVEGDQRWGVGVVADRGTTFANKNGWLSVDNTNGSGENDNGLWITNSVGVVTIHHQQVLMAVLTEHNPDFQTGISLVQALARAAAPTVASSS